jgi:hypothetical protein
MSRCLVRSNILRLIDADESLNREGSLEQDSGPTRGNVDHRYRLKTSDRNSPRRG